ncbi:hypothetical protein K438DRAFT_98918 [Mycena galopus ATCC 62051]|nr:hypothetical protein K438DRAFT_98918 [Mycena galopus ATCC 62051]
MPALDLAAATAIGTGLQAALNGVIKLAEMTLDMKANKKDLSEVGECVKKLVVINPSTIEPELAERLATLTSKLGPLADQCDRLQKKGGFTQFWFSKQHKEKIQGIKDSVASEIRDFTFYGNISIERLVKDMVTRVKAIEKGVEVTKQHVEVMGPQVDHAHKKSILADLKYVPAHYNAMNTGDKCMPGTQVNITRDIVDRLITPQDSLQHRIVMLSGSAGSGKSTIAKTVASILVEEKQALAASFFFSRNYADRREHTFLTSTLASQLADYNKDFENHLINILENDHDRILSAELQLQFQKLVGAPLQQLGPSQNVWIICIDALDECQDQAQSFL